MEDQLPLFPALQETYRVARVIKRNGRLVLFNRDKIANAIYKAAAEVGGSNRSLTQKLAAKVIQMMNRIYPPDATVSVEEIQDLIEKVLIENGHAKTAKAYILYRAERARIREKKESAIVVEDNIPYKLVWKAYSWNVDHDCHSVDRLNRQMRDGRWRQLVLDSEKHYHDEIRKVAGLIAKRRDEVRLMIVAGPSSSGKTTTTYKIGEVLKDLGVSFVLLNLDHYYKDLRLHPKDEYGDYDYEPPSALDLELIDEHLAALSRGRRVRMPQYDFKLGKRTSECRELRLKKGQIILIDSLHGLYADMTKNVPAERKFKFYIEAMCQVKDAKGDFVRWTDLRILRRMVRDGWQRNYQPEKTVGHWHYVRRSEKKYIVPFIRSVDYVFNGSLPYELCVHRNLLDRKLLPIVRAYADDPKKADAYIRARRVHDLLESLEEFPDVASVPENSFLREFIGGGIYRY